MKKVLSYILTLCLCFSMFQIMTFEASAASITVFSQTDSRWGSHRYGYSNTAGTTPTNISSGGCGILSLVNAVHYMNGIFIDPVALADWSVNNGYRVNGVGTSHGLYPAYSNAYGNVYGFSCSSSAGISSWSALKNHLQSGGVAIVPVTTRATGGGHLLVIADYRSSDNTYLILDSYASSNRGTSNGYAWMTSSTFENKMSWSKFILISNTSAPTPSPQPSTCTCSTSYAGTYTTYNVSSNLRIRDQHSTNGNTLGSIPARATFKVSKADGRWAHVTYNGISGYVSMDYIRPIPPIDDRYPTPFKAYPCVSATFEVKTSNYSTRAGEIYTSDYCTIHEVYADGWCKVTYPLNTGGTKTAYTQVSNFVKTPSAAVETYTATKYIDLYATSALTTRIYNYRIFPDDECFIVGTSGQATQIFMPYTGADYYVLGWVAASDIVHKHSYDSWSKHDATNHSRTCSCGSVEKQAHTWNSGAVTQAATCTSGGVKTYTCTVCKATKTETISVKEHTWDNGTERIAATCGDNGVRTYRCSGCGGTFDQIIPATGNHTFDNDCDAICNVCNDTREVGAHIYNGVVTTEPTCTNNGVKTYTCDECGDYYTELISALGHTAEVVSGCDASCGEDGLTEGEQCMVCGEVLMAQQTIPATGAHDYDDEYDADCNVCGGVREVPEKPVIPELPADAPAFVMENVTAREGEEFTVAIRTRNNSGIVSFKLNLAYDTEVLELLSVEEQDFAGMSFGPVANNPFVLNWVDAIHPDNTTDGVVALVTFRVKEGVEAGVTDIALSYDPEDVYDQNYDNVFFRVQDGSVSIVEYIAGDVNGDGKVNNKDLGLLQQHLNGWDVAVVTMAADTNGDGRVNNKDLGLLQQHLNGWDAELG